MDTPSLTGNLGVLAGLGTAVILIAVVSAGGEHGDYSAVTIARTLIATGILLINMAHVVGILFFESLDYHVAIGLL